MHRQPALRHGLFHRWLGIQIFHLRHHVAANQRGQFGAASVGRIERLAIVVGLLHVAQPAPRPGQPFQAGVLQIRLQRAAVGVAAEDGVLDPQHLHRVLDRARHLFPVGHPDANRYRVLDQALQVLGFLEGLFRGARGFSSLLWRRAHCVPTVSSSRGYRRLPNCWGPTGRRRYSPLLHNSRYARTPAICRFSRAPPAYAICPW